MESHILQSLVINVFMGWTFLFWRCRTCSDFPWKLPNHHHDMKIYEVRSSSYTCLYFLLQLIGVTCQVRSSVGTSGAGLSCFKPAMSLDAALHAHLALSAVLSSSTGGAFVCIFWSLWGWFLLKLGFKADYTSIIGHCLPTRTNPKERWLGFVRLLNPRLHCEGLALLLALCSSDEARSCGVHRRLIVCNIPDGNLRLCVIGGRNQQVWNVLNFYLCLSKFRSFDWGPPWQPVLSCRWHGL